MNNDNAITNVSEIVEINEALKSLTKKHKKVSHKKTPPAYVKVIPGQKDNRGRNIEYVELSYMRDIADREFPGWSWTIISSEALGSEAYVVHGRLKWYDNGVWREGDMVAAHRIQKKRTGGGFSNVGNDIKASNTDCMKKAFNTYMNIADDIYRNVIEEVGLTKDQYNKIRGLANHVNVPTDLKSEVLQKLDDEVINKLNYKGSIAKLERSIGV